MREWGILPVAFSGDSERNVSNPTALLLYPLPSKDCSPVRWGFELFKFMLFGSLLALFPDEELLGTLAKDLPFRRLPVSTVVWDGCRQGVLVCS